MADKFPPEKRSQIMANIRGRDTSPERIVKKCLRRLHWHYRSNVGAIPGKPDVVIVGRPKLIFVHGCFWHGHKGCRRAGRPQTNQVFWERKIDGNIKRDKRLLCKLRKAGWSILVVWECQTKDLSRLETRLSNFIER